MFTFIFLQLKYKEVLDKWLNTALSRPPIKLENVREQGKYSKIDQFHKVILAWPSRSALRGAAHCGPQGSRLNCLQFWLIFVAGTYRRVTSHAKSKLEANVAKVGGLLPNSILTLYPLDGEVEPGDENSHHYRSVDGNTRVAVLPKL